MPLYSLAVIDQHGVGRPVVQSLMYREDQSHIEIFLNCAKEWAGPDTFRSSVFMVDKAQAEISALKATFNNSCILLCRFHVAKAFVQQIKKSNLRSDDQELLYKVNNGPFGFLSIYVAKYNMPYIFTLCYINYFFSREGSLVYNWRKLFPALHTRISDVL